MSRKKEFLLVIDTETANSEDQPLPYDIGWAITDHQGNIQIERSFVVAEFFLDYPEMMNTAYYVEKIPQYWNDIKSGKRILKTFLNIRKYLKNDMKQYNVKKVGAYNMNFDRKALNNATRYLTKSFLRWFFPAGTQFFDIWNMACQTLLNTKSYITFAEQNGLVSENNNILTSAESCYRFLTKTVNFDECHMGLEDVKIEIQILVACYRTHKKMDTKIYTACWRIPQKKRKEIAARRK